MPHGNRSEARRSRRGVAHRELEEMEKLLRNDFAANSVRAAAAVAVAKELIKANDELMAEGRLILEEAVRPCGARTHKTL